MPRMTTVKDCITQASLEIGITQRPISSAVGNPDQDIAQMLALIYAVADELLLEEPYRTTFGDGLWIFDGTTSEAKETFATDSDRIGFDARLMINGLKMRFLKAKGLEFGEELRDFTNRQNKLSGAVNGRVLDLETDGGRVI